MTYSSRFVFVTLASFRRPQARPDYRSNEPPDRKTAQGYQIKSRSRKSEQDDKWNFCLTTAIIAVNRRNHEQTTPPEPLTGLQGEGGSGRRQGRPHNRPAGGAFRRSPQSDHGMEIAA